LTTYAVRNWAGGWDDTFHNYFPYKNPATGKWVVIQQDFDQDLGVGAWAALQQAPIYHRMARWSPQRTFYYGWNAPDPRISKQCELPPGYTACNDLGFNALKSDFIGAFKQRFADRVRKLVSKGNVLSTAEARATVEEGIAKFSLEDWLESPAEKRQGLVTLDASAAHEAMRDWPRARNAAAATLLGP
jgi:hypothetical protein